jgi:transposase
VSMHPQPIGTVPQDTVRVAKAAFPKGNVYMHMRDVLGSIYDDEDFSELFEVRGRPAIAPWRLALVTLMQFSEGLSDRQAAEAVRARIDWKYALGLELTDPGFNFSVLSEFRSRLLEGGKERLLLEKLLEGCKERGYLKVRGRARTDSTHVLGALRVLSKWERTAETMRAALNALASVDPQWLTESTPILDGSSVTDGASRTRGCRRARRPGHNTSGRWAPMACGFSGNSMLLTRHKVSKSFQRSKYCAESGSSTTSTSTETYGFSTQKRCLKVLGASNLLTRWRHATLPSVRWVGSATRCTSRRVATKDFLI